MKKEGLIIGVLLLFIINLVSSAPPFITTSTSLQGYDIKIPSQEYIKQNQDYTFYFHIFNKSDGLPVSNVSVGCIYHLYNSSGNHIIEAIVPHDTTNVNNEWEIKVLSGNFSKTGTYNYIVQCNSSIYGGFNEVRFVVTKTGNALTPEESNIYLILTLGVFLIFGLCFYIMLTIPYSNESNEKGAVIKITKAKYFKLLMIGITYSMFVWLLNILIAVSDNFVSLTLYYGFVSFLFTIFLNLTFPVFAIIFVIGLFEIIRDANLYQEIKRLGSALR